MLQPGTQSQTHPLPAQLQRFMASALSRSEAAWVIRHLLKGCPACAQVTRQIWSLGEPAALNPLQREGRA